MSSLQNELLVYGKLTDEQLLDLTYEHDPSDIGVIINEKIGTPYIRSFLGVSNAYVGVQIRSPHTYIRNLFVRNCYSDDVAIRTGAVAIGLFEVIDTHDYVYSDKNHKDILQIYNYDSITNKLRDTPVVDFELYKMELTIGGDNKHIIHCTETCGYHNFHLFKGGCHIKQARPGNLGYLISTTSAVNWTIGSPEHPIDPLLIGDRAIRIDGRKPGSKPSSNVTIHARPGLRLELDESAKAATTVIEYAH